MMDGDGNLARMPRQIRFILKRIVISLCR